MTSVPTVSESVAKVRRPNDDIDEVVWSSSFVSVVVPSSSPTVSNGFVVFFFSLASSLLSLSSFGRFGTTPPFRANSSRSARPTRGAFRLFFVSSSSGLLLRFLMMFAYSSSSSSSCMELDALLSFIAFRGLPEEEAVTGCSKSSAYSSQSKSKSSRHFFIISPFSSYSSSSVGGTHISSSGNTQWSPLQSILYARYFFLFFLFFLSPPPLPPPPFLVVNFSPSFPLSSSEMRSKTLSANCS